jgi:hypothetical protein
MISTVDKKFEPMKTGATAGFSDVGKPLCRSAGWDAGLRLAKP